MKETTTIFTRARRSVLGPLQSHTFAALVRHRNFRLYWFGSLISNVGYWIKFTAQGWLVYDLTGSAFNLGAVAFANTIPYIFLPAFGGVLADRFERRRLMIAAHCGFMLLALTLAYLTLSGTVTVWQITLIAFLSGAVDALNAPVRQTIVLDLVSKEDLMNAIAINSIQFHASRMLGPALAGAIVILAGPGICFLVNGLGYLVVIGALMAVKLPPAVSGRSRVSMWKDITAGLGYVRREPIMFSLLCLAAIPTLFGVSYTALMPAFASAVLGVDAHGLGLLMGAPGMGAVFAAVGVASLGKSVPRGHLLLGAVIGLGLSLSVFAASSSFSLSLATLVVVGFSWMVCNVLNQTFLQTLSEADMHGRVMSVFTLTTYGLQPFGQLGAGVVADSLGPPVAVLSGGIICALSALFVLVRRPYIRRLK